MFRSPAEMRAFASRYTEAWCSQDASSVAAFFSPGGSLTINGGVPALGREAITKAAQSFMTAFPDLHVMQDDVFVKVGRVEYHWSLTGTNTGPGGTGRSVHIQGFESWEIGEDELITSSQGWFDHAEYLRQLGE
jgi:SnoaL-like polyketide cyclase